MDDRAPRHLPPNSSMRWAEWLRAAASATAGSVVVVGEGLSRLAILVAAALARRMESGWRQAQLPAPLSPARTEPTSPQGAPSPTEPASGTASPGARSDEPLADARISVHARDPETLFVWWEISDPTRAAAIARLVEISSTGDADVSAQTVLRVVEIAGGESTERLLAVPRSARSHYVQVARGTERAAVSAWLSLAHARVAVSAEAWVDLPEVGTASPVALRWRRPPLRDGSASWIAPAPSADITAALWQDDGWGPASHDLQDERHSDPHSTGDR